MQGEPPTHRSGVDRENSTTDSLPIFLIAGLTFRLWQWRDVCVGNAIFMVAVEADCRCPTDAESRCPKAAKRLAVFGKEAAMTDEIIELFPVENRTPLAMRAALPLTFQIPVFVALYRSFLNLASTQQINEPFLWIPNLEGMSIDNFNSDM